MPDNLMQLQLSSPESATVLETKFDLRLDQRLFVVLKSVARYFFPLPDLVAFIQSSKCQ